MSECCGGLFSPEQEAREKEREAEITALRSKAVTIDGFKLTLGDIFPDDWALRDFGAKLKLLHKGAESKESNSMQNKEKALFGGDE